jgi:hypothetical protein
LEPRLDFVREPRGDENNLTTPASPRTIEETRKVLSTTAKVGLARSSLMNLSPKPSDGSRSRLNYGRRQALNGEDERRIERTTFRIGRELNHSRFDHEADEDPSTYRQSPDSPHYLGY